LSSLMASRHVLLFVRLQQKLYVRRTVSNSLDI
jgi:hypothetical protein